MCLSDHVKEFHERAVITGGLGRVYGTDMMPILLNLTDRVRLHGVRHQPASEAVLVRGGAAV